MSDGFDERKKGYEEKFAHDSELLFKARARRNRKLGEWVASLLGLEGEAAEEYAKSVVLADLQEVGDEDVFNKVRADLDAKGVDISDHRIRHHMAEFLQEAIAEVKRKG